MRWIIVLAGILLSAPLAAQDDSSVYMGIDLTAEEARQSEQERRSIEAAMLAVLEEGVALGCLEFVPPDTFSQVPNDSAECSQYIARLVEMSEGPVLAEGSGDTLEEAQANTMRNAPLVALAQAAQSGNKRAQLELGMRFEEGRGGVEQNWDNALELYTQAGRATRAQSAVAPNSATDTSVFAGEGGTLGRRQVSSRIPGLREARDRRDALEARMEVRDSD